MGKKKIIFMSPKNEGGTYNYFKDISTYFKNNYPDLDIEFCNSFFDYLKLHFVKADIIITIVPFLFRPFFVKKYIFNLHGNYKIERKNKGLGVKLFYLGELNLFFCDKILLTSYFLADKLNFRQKYERKILISPLFVNNIEKNSYIPKDNKVYLLTFTSSNFIEKGMGILKLVRKIFEIKDLEIEWNLYISGNKENTKIILDEINKIKKGNNIKLILHFEFLKHDDYMNLIKKSQIYVYSTNLDTGGITIMEAVSLGKPIVLFPYELWNYIYPKEFVKDDIEAGIKNILTNYDYYSNLSYNFSKNYIKDKILKEFYKNIILSE